MLYLFDIDGTLIDTGGAGMRALQEATQEIFGSAGPELDLAGSTDRGIAEFIHAHFGMPPEDRQLEDFFAIYHHKLNWHLAHGPASGRVLSGVPEVLTALARRPAATLGLLTGNTATGATAKLQHFKLDTYFGFGAFGGEHVDRNQLGPLALQRAAAHAGHPFTAAQTLVIGDTPKDIACAHAIGARCLAVATGRFSIADLTDAGADRVVATLDAALEWL
ncbi:MAG: HAD family hydrolase [Verrucomicrobia bacterium]|nr:MAG: HAD family hydrolase [Verrucomicrobiota bacterium]